MHFASSLHGMGGSTGMGWNGMGWNGKEAGWVGDGVFIEVALGDG